MATSASRASRLHGEAFADVGNLEPALAAGRNELGQLVGRNSAVMKIDAQPGRQVADARLGVLGNQPDGQRLPRLFTQLLNRRRGHQARRGPKINQAGYLAVDADHQRIDQPGLRLRMGHGPIGSPRAPGRPGCRP